MNLKQRRVCETEDKKNAASFKALACKAVEGEVFYGTSG